MAWLDMFKFPQPFIFLDSVIVLVSQHRGSRDEKGEGHDTDLDKRFSHFHSPSLDEYSLHQTRKIPEAIFCLAPFLFPLLGFKPSWSDELSSHEHHTFRSPRKAQQACLWFSTHATTLYFLSGSDKRLTTSIILSYSSVYAEYVQK